MKEIKLFILLQNVVLLLTSCQYVKDGLTGSKKHNKDEFLVQKKNPLVLPPDFDNLPEPNISVKDIKKGDFFSFNNIKIIRPGNGLNPLYFEKLLKRKSPVNIKKSTPLKINLLKKLSLYK